MGTKKKFDAEEVEKSGRYGKEKRARCEELARELLRRSLAGAREVVGRGRHAAALLEMVSAEVRLAAARMLAVCPTATPEQFAALAARMFSEVAGRVRGGWTVTRLRQDAGVYAVFCTPAGGSGPRGGDPVGPARVDLAAGCRKPRRGLVVSKKEAAR